MQFHLVGGDRLSGRERKQDPALKLVDEGKSFACHIRLPQGAS
jgi:hypothetical protein